MYSPCALIVGPAYISVIFNAIITHLTQRARFCLLRHDVVSGGGDGGGFACSIVFSYVGVCEMSDNEPAATLDAAFPRRAFTTKLSPLSFHY